MSDNTYYWEHREELQERARLRYARKRELILKQQRAYYRANRDAIRLADKIEVGVQEARRILTEEATV